MGCLSPSSDAIAREKNKQLKVTIPNDLHRKLKIISELNLSNVSTQQVMRNEAYFSATL
jgi:hypothetical protein